MRGGVGAAHSFNNVTMLSNSPKYGPGRFRHVFCVCILSGYDLKLIGYNSEN